MGAPIVTGLHWIKENPPYWDKHKAAIIGAAPAGTFAQAFPSEIGTLLSGQWWRVERNREVAGYGWMDVNWGDAEILLCTHPGVRRTGIGSFILEQLENEALEQGVNYIYNVVNADHPEREELTRWLTARSFSGSEDGKLLRAVCRPSQRPPAPQLA
ncbi:MAG: GNAT family N-acetyltransferase [Myxococcota bacterium]